MNSKIRIGVIGAGKLGSRHAELYTELKDIELVGVCDVDPKRAKETAKKCHTQSFTRYEDLIGKIDAASIVVPSHLHYEISKKFLEAGIHLLIEKPITTKLEDADELLSIAKQKNLIIQVGHIERFNSAIRAIKDVIKTPRFIECHRLGPYDPRVKDTGVTLDLMIHDIDIILDLVQSPVKHVDSVGAFILSPTEDIANARIRFENGSVCDLTASRVTKDVMRKIRIFQDDAYISLDYVEKEALIYTKDENGIHEKKINTKKNNSLLEELEDFVQCMKTRQKPLVSGEEGRNALALALEISNQIAQLKEIQSLQTTRS